MGRRYFLFAFGIMFSLFIISCKKDNLPTLITGKVFDEKGQPIENIPFTFGGYRSYGGSPAGGGKQEITFNLKTLSDKEGNFNFSQVVPEGTTDLSFMIGGDAYFPYERYKIFAKKNNVDIGLISSTIDSYIFNTNIKYEYEIILTKK